MLGSGFASGFFGGGGGLSTSASATSGPATSGSLGLTIQGITTGGSSSSGGVGVGGMPQWIWPVIAVVGGLIALRMVRR